MSRSHSNQAEAVLELRAILRRYPWHFILPAFTVMSLVLLAGLFMPRKYRAEATFDRRTDMVMAEIMQRGAPRSMQNPKQSLVEELSGDIALNQLVKTIDLASLNLPDTPAYRQQLRSRIGRRVIVTFDVNSTNLDRVSVEYVDENPHLARLVVNTLVQNYIDRTREQNTQALKQSESFFKSEVERSRKNIDTLEGKLVEFELKHGELLPDNPSSFQNLATEIIKQANEVKRQREAAALKHASLQKHLENTQPEFISQFVGRNPDRHRLEQRLFDLRTEESTYVGVNKMTDKHPDLIALRSQIALVEAQLAKLPIEVVTQKQTVQNPKYTELEMQVSAAEGELASLDRQVGELSAQVQKYTELSAKMFSVRADHRKLQRSIDQAQRQLAFWEDNLRSIGMASAADSGERGIKLEFISPCQEIRKPISPDLAQVITAAVGLGLIAGGLCLFFAHRTEQTFSDGDQLAQAMNLPLMGSVSEIITQADKAKRHFRKTVLYPAGVVAMAVVILALTSLLYISLERTSQRGLGGSVTTSDAAKTAEPIAAAPEN